MDLKHEEVLTSIIIIKTNKTLLTRTLTKTMVKAWETNFAATTYIKLQLFPISYPGLSFFLLSTNTSLMNNQRQKDSNPFNRDKVAKAISIQTKLHKTQARDINFSQVDMHEMVRTIFKVLLPFLVLLLIYISNQ